jgi:DNA-binding response OmpR family regulator
MNKLILKPFNNKILVSVIKRHCHHHSKTNFCKFTDQANPSSQLEVLNLKLDKLNKQVIVIEDMMVYSYFFNVIVLPITILLTR